MVPTGKGLKFSGADRKLNQSLDAIHKQVLLKNGAREVGEGTINKYADRIEEIAIEGARMNKMLRANRLAIQQVLINEEANTSSLSDKVLSIASDLKSLKFTVESKLIVDSNRPKHLDLLDDQLNSESHKCIQQEHTL